MKEYICSLLIVVMILLCSCEPIVHADPPKLPAIPYNENLVFIERRNSGSIRQSIFCIDTAKDEIVGRYDLEEFSYFVHLPKSPVIYIAFGETLFSHNIGSGKTTTITAIKQPVDSMAIYPYSSTQILVELSRPYSEDESFVLSNNNDVSRIETMYDRMISSTRGFTVAGNDYIRLDYNKLHNLTTDKTFSLPTTDDKSGYGDDPNYQFSSNYIEKNFFEISYTCSKSFLYMYDSIGEDKLDLNEAVYLGELPNANIRWKYSYNDCFYYCDSNLMRKYDTTTKKAKTIDLTAMGYTLDISDDNSTIEAGNKFYCPFENEKGRGILKVNLDDMNVTTVVGGN